jgi:hypothetical protein
MRSREPAGAEGVGFFAALGVVMQARRTGAMREVDAFAFSQELRSSD